MVGYRPTNTFCQKNIEIIRFIFELMIENEELKRNLALSLNKDIVKRLNESLRRINNGEFVSEEEFFNRK